MSNNKLKLSRIFTRPGEDAYTMFPCTTFDAEIKDETGKVFFKQEGIQAPIGWSQTAVNIVASKYFRGQVGTPERESSVIEMVRRVVDTITKWGISGDYFETDEDAETFRQELVYMILSQRFSFNSPVWFNIGVPGRRQQASACFINSVNDTMESILELAKTEGMLFKFGSGTGTNLSSLREEGAPLSGGGTSSGPVSFMRGYDAFAGVIKSGGGTRRAAKMVILNDSHPDILEFVRTKAVEEKKAHALIAAGYSPEFNVKGGAYDSVDFQNANHSVRVSDDFMNSWLNGEYWTLRSVKGNEPVGTISARELFREMADAAWFCGDPGIQFDDTINRWHTVPNSGRINASNPCSEFVFLDDTACNLASINLLKFLDDSDVGVFNVTQFRQACKISIIAQEILVGGTVYPTEKIAFHSYMFRPLGLGYANLGALLMASGLPYDSSEGRDYAAAITAIMHATALITSAEIAAAVGPFDGYEENRSEMLAVIDRHVEAAKELSRTSDNPLANIATGWMLEARRVGGLYGYRNAQVTLLAPTGTIAFMMDCSTTGIEPEISLIKYKKLVGGGTIEIVNSTVARALRALGYGDQTDWIIREMKEIGIEQVLTSEEHKAVFDCSIMPSNGVRSIRPMGHVEMMAIVQPFLSGAISKTVNMPNESTVEDIEDIYRKAWELGVKCIAVYRDGCKISQPLSVSEPGKKEEEKTLKTQRRKMPRERASITHKFSISGHDGYITAGMFEDGTLGEIFICMSKEGSTISGLMDSVALITSIALQHGVPLETLVNKLSHYRFEPSGFTTNPDIPMAKSITDYIFRWLELKFIRKEEVPSTKAVPNPIATSKKIETGPPCPTCGTITTRNGSCHKCDNCGSTTGCS